MLEVRIQAKIGVIPIRYSVSHFGSMLHCILEWVDFPAENPRATKTGGHYWGLDFEYTCVGVMIFRADLKNPWIFVSLVSLMRVNQSFCKIWKLSSF